MVASILSVEEGEEGSASTNQEPIPTPTHTELYSFAPLGVQRLNRTRKFKVVVAWRRAYPQAQHILAEYDHGALYRAYRSSSTIHQSGSQRITALLLFQSHSHMARYIAARNLPTEKYHTYTARQLAPGKYAITGFKIRYNHQERTAYITLPLQNGHIKDTTLRPGDTVNITLHDPTTNTTNHTALHKILSKEHNYCAIRLSPTTTHHYQTHHQIHRKPLLATQHIHLTIQRIPLTPKYNLARYAAINIAKPALLEALFKEPGFMEGLLSRIGYSQILEMDLHFGPDGRRRPDMQLFAEKNGRILHVIGECKACKKCNSNRIMVEAAIQLLSYKLDADPEGEADEGLLVVTGNPAMPDWNRIVQAATKYARRNSHAKICLYSKRIIGAGREETTMLKGWFENHVELIDSHTIREVITKSETSEQLRLREAILTFIEN